MHRTATFYDLKITARGVSQASENEANFETDPLSLREMYALIDQLFKGGDPILKKGRSEKSARYYISDLELRNDRLIFLINRCDPNAPDAVSSDPENKSRVVHTKPPGHGGDYSAHVIIPLQPTRGDNYYLCVVETVFGSGLHASSIKDYMRFIFAYCRKHFPERFLIPNINGARDADGNPLMVRHIHTVELLGHPSSEFQEELETGVLTGIELLDFTERGAVWDDRGAVFEDAKFVKLRPQRSLAGSLAAMVRQVRNKAAEQREYAQMRIRFKNEKGEPRDATIDTDTGNLVDINKYIKRHIIQAPLVNVASLNQINNGIIKEMLELME
ncbi:hypothetical protein FBY21_1659 [Pseudomonas sp. SLBN-26]|uniref:hypothetical protein n=1 Tax=Pseudomonadaceae TaxID=135621 RepID=UPI00115334E8|nr:MULTISPECIES: hypothetical protein [Pseudomonas]MCP1617058.1 hypothetical protein [Pseudomonas otitidis]TQL06301.1 hypothetical protein FBY21_1659 [Pseudomonas sp. SLBN-26]